MPGAEYLFDLLLGVGRPWLASLKLHAMLRQVKFLEVIRGCSIVREIVLPLASGKMASISRGHLVEQ